MLVEITVVKDKTQFRTHTKKMDVATYERLKLKLNKPENGFELFRLRIIE